MKWRALDLFSGIGGWSLAAHRKGIETVAACEIDDWKWGQYSRHFPNVIRYRDVRDVTRERLQADGRLPIDIVVGSPPCTDISTANHAGLGVDGEESRLYFEAIRIVSEIRPRWCAFENSDNLRSRGADRVLAALEAEGYACWPCVVGAVHAGAPHRRLRSWLIAAHADSTGLRVQPGRSSRALGQGSSESSPDDRQRSPDASVLGRRTRRTRRLGASPSRQQDEQQPRQAEAASDSHGIERWAGRREVDANGHEPAGRCSIQNDDADADGQRKHRKPEHEEMVGRSGNAGCVVADRTGGGGVTMPTPTARDWKSGKCSEDMLRKNSRPLNEALVSTGMTDPVLLLTVYELMMGFPPGWLAQPALDAVQRSPNSTEPEALTETPLSSRSSKRSSKGSSKPMRGSEAPSHD